MDSNPQPPFADKGDDYNRLYAIAIEKKPDFDLENGTCAIAILPHEKDAAHCKPADFIWLKVKCKHTVAKLKAHYLKKYHTHVELRLGCFIPSDTIEVHQLLAPAGDFPILTTHQINPRSEALHGIPSPSASSSIRTPLRVTYAQLYASPVTPLRDVKPVIKSESGRALSLENVQQVPTISPVQYHTRVKNEHGRSPGPSIAAQPRTTITVKAEAPQEDEEDVSIDLNPQAAKKARSQQLQKLMDEGTPDELEAEVRDMQILLAAMKKPMATMVSEQQDAKHWVQQIDNLLKHVVDTPTVIGVVGNTGAGKSSVINAMLEEERLVPTNCMRACTAVVTEMSYNHSDKPNAKYRAQIEFIKANDWKKDLELSFSELLDSNGQVSRDCTNEESEAGVAYAKLKSVYPQKTNEMLAECTVEQLMNDPAVKRVLGTTMIIERPKSDTFYRALQNVIDSKEKKKGEKKEMELWPLIKVVKLYTKADALSTGAVIVDLPGVHDSNAARAAVAAGYMKQCTGLFIVAPINRAVDDKAAKSLLGESFKRQLKFDGTYSRITFICSKTDDISITEASDSLGLEDEMSADWDRIDEIEKKVRELKKSQKDLLDTKAVYFELIHDADEQIEIWEELQEKVEKGEEIWASEISKPKSTKRKRTSESKKPRKKARELKDEDSEDDFIDDGDEDEDEHDEEDEEAQEDTKDSDEDSDEEGRGEPLTVEAIEEKISKFKEDKKRARAERTEIDAKMKPINDEIKVLEKKKAEINAAMSAICIAGRNNYSRGAIQRDFADGIRELDMENAQEEDPDQFDPEDQIRDYEEVARSLPVFCVSSRAHQKLSGRLQRDANVSGFRTAEETEIPQLQAHCKKLTEGGRAANCRAFLTNFGQLLTSLHLWASNDGSGVNLSDAQLALETRFLKTRLLALEKSLQISVKSSLSEMTTALAEHLFENYDDVVDLAKEEAPRTCQKWHRKPNRDDRAAGGYYWATYKAICRREGVFANGQGPHDFNASLAEPIIINLASHWERVFAQRLPRVLQSFNRQSKNHLNAFHKEIETRSTKLGHGVAGLGLLGENLRNYEGIFATLSSQMLEVINALQREANREFTPVILRKLESAYNMCAQESGPGQFNRMKNYMEAYINEHRTTMFDESVNEVKRRLDLMCEEVEEAMLARSDDVYTMMSRDYLSVMGGSKLPDGQIMPRWERKMRADVLACIENRDEVISEAKDAEAKRLAEEARLEMERVAAVDKREKEEAEARKKKADEEKAARKKLKADEAAKKKIEEEESAKKKSEGEAKADSKIEENVEKEKSDEDAKKGLTVGGESAVVGSPKVSKKDAEDDEIMDMN